MAFSDSMLHLRIIAILSKKHLAAVRDLTLVLNC